MRSIGFVSPFAARLDVDRSRTVLLDVVIVVVGGALAGMAAAGHEVSGPLGILSRLPIIGTLPLALIVAVAAGVALIPVALRDWRIPFWAFWVWLPLEDLFRKLAGNDIRIYVVKDFFFAIALLGLANKLRALRAWRSSLGPVRWAILLLLGWSLALAVPAALDDLRAPLVGLRLNFMYLPLVPVGYFVTQDADRLRRVLVGLTAIAAVALTIGIAQSIVGPGFLAPSVETPGLANLVLERSAPITGDVVYQPTGTFVDPGRFASMAVVGLVIGIAAVGSRGLRGRWAVVGLTTTAFVATWVSAGRTAVVASVILLVVALVGPRGNVGRGRAASRLILGTLTAVAVLFGLSALSPSASSSRVDYYLQTLDPRSTANEWSFRLEGRTTGVMLGIRKGGILGRGTGTQSIGRQYLYGGEERALTGLTDVESGWGSVAIELGAMGLVVWIVWAIAWWIHVRRCFNSLRGTPWANVALVPVTWIGFYLFIAFSTGYAAFQNYLSNAYFWFLSGVVFGLPALANSTSSSLSALGNNQRAAAPLTQT